MLTTATLQCGRRQLDLSFPQIMGVLNVTPDSFSDGGKFTSKDAALNHASAMVEAGAAIIDVGGESTRPGAKPVSEQEELDRVVPVIEMLSSELDTIISVDTSTPSVIQAAARAGAGMINDVRALMRDKALDAAKGTGLPVCLMHMQGQPETMQLKPEYAGVVEEVFAFLESRVAACVEAGIAPQRLLLDPGFGFGKTLEHNLQLLRQLNRFQDLNLPVLIGLSRKTMIGALINKPPEERVFGSAAAAMLAVQRGANIVRVHDVAATSDMLCVLQAVTEQQA